MKSKGEYSRRSEELLVCLTRKNDASVRRLPMRVNIREAVQISSHRYGRDALPRDPAWHVSKVVFGFSRGRSRSTADMVFVRVYGRATPDRAGARHYHGDRPYTLC